MGQEPPVAGVIDIISSHDAVISIWLCLVESRVFGELWQALSVAIDVFPALTVDIRKFIRRYTHYIAIFLMQGEDGVAHLASSEGLDAREVCRGPPSWARIDRQWVEIDVVDQVTGNEDYKLGS